MEPFIIGAGCALLGFSMICLALAKQSRPVRTPAPMNRRVRDLIDSIPEALHYTVQENVKGMFFPKFKGPWINKFFRVRCECCNASVKQYFSHWDIWDDGNDDVRRVCTSCAKTNLEASAMYCHREPEKWHGDVIKAWEEVRRKQKEGWI